MINSNQVYSNNQTKYVDERGRVLVERNISQAVTAATDELVEFNAVLLQTGPLLSWDAALFRVDVLENDVLLYLSYQVNFDATAVSDGTRLTFFEFSGNPLQSSLIYRDNPSSINGALMSLTLAVRANAGDFIRCFVGSQTNTNISFAIMEVNAERERI